MLSLLKILKGFDDWLLLFLLKLNILLIFPFELLLEILLFDKENILLLLLFILFKEVLLLIILLVELALIFAKGLLLLELVLLFKL